MQLPAGVKSKQATALTPQDHETPTSTKNTANTAQPTNQDLLNKILVLEQKDETPESELVVTKNVNTLFTY